MIDRRPVEHAVFEDVESVRRYAQGIDFWMAHVAKSFAAIIRNWGVTDGRALDVGCGTGILMVELAKSFPQLELVGLDLSQAVLTVAREQIAEVQLGPRVSFQHGDAQDMPFEDGCFDLAVSSNTLHLLKNPLYMFNEVQRVLRPTGRFIISDFRRSWLGSLTQHIRTAYTPQEVEGLLHQSKLENWKVQDGLLWLTVLSHT